MKLVHHLSIVNWTLVELTDKAATIFIEFLQQQGEVGWLCGLVDLPLRSTHTHMRPDLMPAWTFRFCERRQHKTPYPPWLVSLSVCLVGSLFFSTEQDKKTLGGEAF